MNTLTLNRYIIKEKDLLFDNDDKRYVLRVRDLQVEDKPREKLIRLGSQNLVLSAMIAIL